MTTYLIYLISDLIKEVDNDQPATSVDGFENLELFVELHWLWDQSNSEVITFFADFKTQQFEHVHQWGPGVKNK